MVKMSKVVCPNSSLLRMVHNGKQCIFSFLDGLYRGSYVSKNMRFIYFKGLEIFSQLIRKCLDLKPLSG